ncbi:Hypothetical protein NTJ_03087 [Nesidiocoris tenuis]|uniref:Uncharacterized protein n=1 Tax=Nesidiocoris tenuis TaxID=355587 RepID=A0ABN7ADD5_9HEMI|nr:Hypothetical protein NTJ_03087 [Nesidiocoris tenuis]
MAKVLNVSLVLVLIVWNHPRHVNGDHPRSNLDSNIRPETLYVGSDDNPGRDAQSEIRNTMLINNFGLQSVPPRIKENLDSIGMANNAKALADTLTEVDLIEKPVKPLLDRQSPADENIRRYRQVNIPRFQWNRTMWANNPRNYRQAAIPDATSGGTVVSPATVSNPVVSPLQNPIPIPLPQQLDPLNNSIRASPAFAMFPTSQIEAQAAQLSAIPATYRSQALTTFLPAAAQPAAYFVANPSPNPSTNPTVPSGTQFEPVNTLNNNIETPNNVLSPLPAPYQPYQLYQPQYVSLNQQYPSWTNQQPFAANTFAPSLCTYANQQRQAAQTNSQCTFICGKYMSHYRESNEEHSILRAKYHRY